MKTWFAKHKKIASIGVLTLLVVLMATGVLAGILAHKKNPAIPDESETVNFNVYQNEVEKLDNHDDIGVMIVDCDARESFKNLENIDITQRKGKYVQGTGACHLLTMVSKNAIAYFNEVDISAYAKGSVHMSLYVNDPSYVGTSIVVELTSSAYYDKDEISWTIPAGALKAGWNELYLGVENATKKGEPDLTRINYFRVYCAGPQSGLDVFVDAIYATNTEPSSLEVVKQDNMTVATRKPGFLMDFDSLDGLQSTGSLGFTDAKGEYKEGAGAVYVLNPTSFWISANLQPTDISAYADGKITYWLYVHDVNAVKNGRVYLEISSGGKADKEELSWRIGGDTLVSGWNQIVFSIPGGSVTPDGGADLTKINFVRMYGVDCSTDALLILDGLQLVPRSTIVPENGMILNCDSMKGITATSANTMSITNKSGEFTEGSGALKSVGDKNGFWTIAFADAIDVSKYKEGGIHVSLYVSDTSKLEAFAIELSSSGKPDVDEYQWNLTIVGLKNGWNELELKFASASVKGTPNLGALNYMRVYGKVTGELTAIIDDVRAIYIEDVIQVPEDGMILNCDTVNKIKVSSDNAFSITEDAAEHKEGTGAFKSVGSKSVWWRITLEEVVDVSKYKDGGIHASIYVSDPTKLTSKLNIEIGSGGKPDKDEYQWGVSGLQPGWNELILDFASAGVTGTPDLSAINFVRVYRDSTEEIVMILDDLRATLIENDDDNGGEEENPTKFVLSNCDATFKGAVTEVTTIAGEFKEGTGAAKKTDTANNRFQIRPKDIGEAAWDFTNYKEGTLHLWLYVSDVSALPKDFVRVTLGDSNGGFDKLNWDIPKSELTDGGWTELFLDLSDPTHEETTFEWSSIQGVKVHLGNASAKSDLITIVDDIYVTIEKITDEQEPTNLVLHNCDETFIGAVTEVTTTAGEFKEGTGAAKTTGNANNRFQYTQKYNNKAAWDLSAYQEGTLHLWFYVSDVSKLPNDYVVVAFDTVGSSFGGEESCQYRVPKSELTDGGWTELFIDLSSPSYEGPSFDWSVVQGIKVYLGKAASEELTTIVDDIYVTAGKVEGGESGSSDITQAVDFLVDVESGKEITVLQLSDTQMTNDGQENYRCFDYIRETVEATNPDLIILTGDLVYGQFDSEGASILALIDVMEELGTPWAPVFGNHDGEIELGIDWICEQFKNAEHCLFEQRTLTGNGNYTVGIRQDGELKRIYFMLDSNGYGAMSDATKANGHSTATEGFGADQIEWYTETAENIKRISPNTKLSFAFHIQLKAFEDAYAKYGFDSTDVAEGTSVLNTPINIDTLQTASEGDFGYLGRALKSVWDTEYTVWNGLKALGVDSIFVGHEHCNSASVVYEGIRCQFGQKTGTYDRANYLALDGSIVGSSSTSAGMPIVGGTVMTLDDNGYIDDAHIYYAGDYKYDEISTIEGMLVSGNTMKSMNVTSDNNMHITTAEGEYTEGGRAFKSVGSKSVWWKVILQNAVDISAYQDGGIHISLYISDPTKLTSNLCFEIGSDGKPDANEYQWRVSGLQPGWNELLLDFANVTVTGTPDLTSINFFRVYRESTEDITMILDDVRAVLLNEEDTPSKFVLQNCDATFTGAVTEVTTTVGEFKEGTGAAKKTDTANNRFQIRPMDIGEEAWNLTDYKEGTLHLWLYVSDVSALPKDFVRVTFGDSNGGFDKLNWDIPKSELTDGGWTELFLDLSNPTYEDTSYDWSSIQGVKVHLGNASATSDLVTIVDDIYVTTEKITGEPESAKLVIHNCDATYTGANAEVTTVAGEFKEGTGAAKQTGTANNRFQYSRRYTDEVAFDLSAYQEGTLHLWFYVSDVSKLPNDYVVVAFDTVGSSFSGEESCQYRVPKSELVNGWTELFIDLSSPHYEGPSFDWSEVQGVKVHLGKAASEELTTIVDDIYIVEK